MRTCTLLIGLLLLLQAQVDAQAQIRPIDVEQYRFQIELSDTTNRIQGKAQIRFTAASMVNSVTIDLGKYGKDGKGMQVRKIERTGSNPSRLSFEWISADKIHIALDQPLRKGEEAEIQIEYDGVPRDGLIISKNKYGNRTFFADNWPNRAHQWIPCVDEPGDKAAVAFHVTAPDKYAVIANGIQQSREINQDRATTHWEEKTPLPTKVMVIGVAQFAVDTVGYFQKSIPVTSWVFPPDSSIGFNTYAQALPILEWMSNYIGPYAYKKLANVQSKTIFGGMENASAIFYYENSVKGSGDEEALIAHEIAHQWFGNMATEKSFHHLWLSEGFATYLTHLYLESTYGDSMLKTRLQADREKINEFLSRTPRSVIDTSANYMSLLNANSYEKGGWVLHMLRKQVGDSVFQQIIRAYYETYQGKNADTDDFRKVVESITATDWSAFFNQWLTQKVNPSLQIQWENSADGKFTTLLIRQLQQTAPFSLPLSLDLMNDAGTKKRVTIRVTKTEETFILPVHGIINSIVVDPDTELLIEKLIVVQKG